MMLKNFNSNMYDSTKITIQEQEEEIDMLDRTLLDTVQLFAADDD